MLHPTTRNLMAHVHSRQRQAFAALSTQLDGESGRHGLKQLGLDKAELLSHLKDFRGQIVWPWEPDYNTDRALFNPLFDAYPVVILYCTVASDAVFALTLAKLVEERTKLAFTVRSGGHCTAGFSAGAGVLIDMSQINDVYVDAAGMTATVGCGVNFGKFRAALLPYKLHVPGGECDDVCIGGYMQGGGYGFTSVTYGMNCDNVISMTVLLANGTIVTASETVNRDLWWGMRGGTGGTLGILLNVTYKLVTLGDVFGWAIIWPIATAANQADAVTALNLLQDNYMATAPSKQLNIQVSLCYQPGIVAGLPLPPAAMQPYLMVRGVWVGNATDGQAAIQALCNSPGATTQWTKTASFDVLNTELLNLPYGMPCFAADAVMPREDKASRIVARKLTSAEWQSLLAYFVSTPNPYSYFYMEFYGGAINEYPVADSAWIHRDALYNAVLDVFWWEEADRAASQAFLDGWIALMEPLYNGHAYQNYPRLGDPNWADKYWGDAQGKLAAVKGVYDPKTLFTFAQCIVQRN
ncbi:MAG: FAD-binding oxidoreductase [Betaproteobacteria bacterium]|nr:MAG: FAD-binding oxidoreductase [Betaproteobacteria bacterium]